MDQFVGHLRDESTVRDLLLAVAPPARPERRSRARRGRGGAHRARRDRHPDAPTPPRSPTTRMPADTTQETLWDTCTIAALGIPYERAKYRAVTSSERRRAEAARPRGAAPRTRGGAAARRAGQLPRRSRQALARGDAARDEQDRAAGQPRPRAAGARGRPDRHARTRRRRQHGLGARRRLRRATTTRGPSGWSASTSCGAAGTRSTRSCARLVATMKVKATASDEFASRYRAAQTRLRKFEEAGPPQARAARAERDHAPVAARAPAVAPSSCEQLELTGLMQPFDLEVWFGERVAVLGLERIGQVALPAAAGARGHRSRPAGGPRHHRSAQTLDPVAAHRRRPARRPRGARAGSRRRTSIPS